MTTAYETLAAERDAAREAATVEAVDALPEVAALLAVYQDAPEGSDAERAAWTAYDVASDAAMALAEGRETAAQLALEAYRGPRPWILSDDQGQRTSLPECSLDAARVAAEEYSRDSGYTTDGGTIWDDVRIIDPATGDVEETVTTQIDPDEPECGKNPRTGRSYRGHRWLDDGTPGFGSVVRGHGGGVICAERCSRCGIRRVTDTWAQRPDTGEQGLTAVSYEEAP